MEKLKAIVMSESAINDMRDLAQKFAAAAQRDHDEEQLRKELDQQTKRSFLEKKYKRRGR